ncbi:MAG: hypothetical protein C6H99_06960 [Epsilonproteobacteria bacterium]|nr:hypothetical protein [Campylobacterota bacterium]NPA64266.1 prepilin-type N-terminal cleavage/methylation domain-containing protein [Campylobacterota bacterium]
MKRGFTIIEVIISVVVLALVGVALLRSGAMNLELLEKIKNKQNGIDLITIAANHRNEDYNHLTKALEDFLPFSGVDDDELRRILKKKYLYKEYILKAKMPSMDEGLDEDDQESENIINVSFVKLSLQNEEGGEYIYVLELDE